MARGAPAVVRRWLRSVDAALRHGIVASTIFGFARTWGEALAVTSDRGSQGARAGRFCVPPGDTMASRIAASTPGTATALQRSSLATWGALLIISLINQLARVIWRPCTAAGRRGGESTQDVHTR